MKWFFKVLGTHTHVRVFMNSAICGKLCFRNEEFNEIRRKESSNPVEVIRFIEEEE